MYVIPEIHEILTSPIFYTIAFIYVYLFISLILITLIPAEPDQDSVTDVSTNTTRSLRSRISSACGHQ